MKSLILTRLDREGRQSGEDGRGRFEERGEKRLRGQNPQSRTQNKERRSQTRPHTVHSQTGGNRLLLEPRALQINT